MPRVRYGEKNELPGSCMPHGEKKSASVIAGDIYRKRIIGTIFSNPKESNRPPKWQTVCCTKEALLLFASPSQNITRPLISLNQFKLPPLFVRL